MTLGPTPTAVPGPDHNWANVCVPRVLPPIREADEWYVPGVAMVRTGKSPSNPSADRGNACLPVVRDGSIAENSAEYGSRGAKKRCEVELRDIVIGNTSPSTSNRQNRLRQSRGN
jgi:hypothetical protein